MPISGSYEHTQWAVGQGFFHSGLVAIDDVEFDYVYDCGVVGPGTRNAWTGLRTGQQAINAEIDAYAHQLQSRRGIVDVAYLSHFDRDHVNKVSELAKKVRIQKFVIPGISAWERLLSFARGCAHNSPNSPTAGSDWDWYMRLIENPNEVLNEHSEEETITVDERLPEPDDETPLIPESDETSISSPAPGSPDAVFTSLGKGTATGPMWTVRPFTRHAVNTGWAAFVKELHKLLTSHTVKNMCQGSGALTEAQLEADLTSHRPQHLHSLITMFPETLGKAYKKIHGDKNSTSLFLYCGPTNNVQDTSEELHLRGNNPRILGPWIKADPAWLGTGDAPMVQLGTAAPPVDPQEVEQAYRRLLQRVGVMSVPHHGARNGVDSAALATLFGTRGDIAFEAAHGAGNRYGHPRLQPKQAILSRRNSTFTSVTQDVTTRSTRVKRFTLR